MNRNVVFLLAALVCSPWITNAQTVPCECLDGSLDGVITNTDFLPFIMDWVWGDSISDGTEVGPGACDLDGDGTYNVHDIILFTSQQQQNCEELDGLEVLTLLDTAESTFQGWVLELVTEHNGELSVIPAGAKTYRLYADFATIPGADMRMMGLWGDSDASWSIHAPGGLYVSSLSGSDENTLPMQDGINPSFFSFLPELEFSSFWTLADMWAESPGFFGMPYLFDNGSVEGQGSNFQSGMWSSEDTGGSGLLAVGGSIWNERLLIEGLTLVGQFTTLEGQDVTGQAGLVVGVGPPGTYLLSELMVVSGEPFDMTDLVVFGCTNEAASNYDAGATYDDESCISCSPADGDCDGIVGVNDLLDLLSQFGCSADCGWGDIDGDGVVGVGDILALLSLFEG
ncbi:MAG: hypothetical protein HOM41_02135 [Flavobacteriales bacterium]|nr:hypothetical protein [Flavobacteriales bacterium]